MSNSKMDDVLSFVINNAKFENPQSVLDTIDHYAIDGSLDKKRFLMNIGPEKGAILKETIKKHGSKKILELGAFIGYSAVLIGMTMDDDATLVSIDPDENSIRVATEMVKYAGLDKKVTFVKNTAEEAIRKFNDKFDLVFIDHAKKRYFPDLLLLEENKLLENGAVIFADNVGLFAEDMVDYFEHVRNPSLYSSTNIGSHLEYRNNIILVIIFIFGWLY